MADHKRKLFARAGVLIDDYGIQIGLGICSVVFAACCLALSSEVLDQIMSDQSHHATIKKWAVRSLWGVLVASALLWLVNLKQAKRVSVLEEQVESLSKEKQLLADNVGALIEGYLLNVALWKLGFGERDNCDDRITLFSHDEQGGSFIMVGRYSDNPTLHKTKRRHKYPDTEGCLAKAWQNGSDFMNDLPDPSGSLDAYAAHQGANGFPEGEARQLTMKSRLYYAYRVMDTRHRNPIAAVVVESTHHDRFTRDQLDQVFNNQERVFMSDLLEVLQPHLTVPSDAAKAGY